MRTRAFAVLVALVLLGAGPGVAQDDCKANQRRSVLQTHVPRRIIVKPRLTFSVQDVIASGAFRRDWKIEPIGPGGSVRIDAKRESTEELRALFNDPARFERVEEDVYIQPHSGPEPRATPSDPDFSKPAVRRWLDDIHAPEAWIRGTGDRSVVAAIVDSGINPDHEDLQDNVFSAKKPFSVPVFGERVDCDAGAFGFDAVMDDCHPFDDSSHGSMVAGIIGAVGDNGKGVTGVNWRVTLLPVTLFTDEQSGCGSRAVRALEFVREFSAKKQRVRVVNLSWGQSGDSAEVREELERLAADDIVIVASVGNDGQDNDAHRVFPASYTSVPTLISVAAADSKFNLLPSSNFGPSAVDIAAPGCNIQTTTADGRILPFSFTSAAAPVVTGAVALLASQCPGLSALQLRDLILGNADRRASLIGRVQNGRFLNINRASKACTHTE